MESDQQEEKDLSLLELADWCMAHSMLVFLLADVRLLSSLGYIRTKYEHVCIDSDLVPRRSARDLAGFGTKESEEPTGITAAHIMCLLLLEIRREVEAVKGNKEMTPLLNQTPTQNFRRDVRAANGLPALLRCYNEMLSADLVDHIPRVSRDLYPLDDRTETSSFNRLRRADFDPDVSGEDEDGRETLFPRLKVPSCVAHNFGTSSKMGVRMSIVTPDFRPSLLVSQSQKLKREFESVADVQGQIFSGSAQVPLAETDRFYDDEDLKELIVQSLESRESWKLGFMKTFFRENTVSHSLASSKTETVWLNDWHEQYELTYAISIDREKKKVIVAFRGAYTKSDWNHIMQWYDTGTSNPIKEDYPNKPKVGVIEERGSIFSKEEVLSALRNAFTLLTDHSSHAEYSIPRGLSQLSVPCEKRHRNDKV